MIGLLCFALAVPASPFKSTLGSSGSRTMIAGSLPSCIAGFQQSCGFSQSFGPRRSCVGTGPVFVAIGVGKRTRGEVVRRSICRISARSSICENPLWGAPRSHGELLDDEGIEQFEANRWDNE